MAYLGAMEVMTSGIAAQIRAELAKRKMTLGELSEKTGLSQASISRKVSMESRGLTAIDLHKIATALDLPVSELYRRAETEKVPA